MNEKDAQDALDFAMSEEEALLSQFNASCDKIDEALDKIVVISKEIREIKQPKFSSK